MVDANGNRTEYKYDELGRQIAVVDALGNVTRTEYDQAGNVIAEIDGLGNRTEYQYDPLNRQTAVIDALDETTLTEYDDAGNVLSITDPVDNQTTYAYDARDRLVLETNELGYTRTFEYDAVGNQMVTTDRKGRVREFTYDGLNRQIEENWLNEAGNSIRTIASEYDAASQLVATSDPDSSYTFTYDDLGRLLTVDNEGTPEVPNVVLTYTYDEEGNIIAVRDTIEGEAGGITTYEYDQLDRVTQIAQTGNSVAEKRVDFAYDAIGQYETMTRYSDLQGTNLVVESSYDYDEANRLTELTHSNSSETVAFYDFAYDAASRITQITDVDGTTDYSYDETDQLIEAERTDEANPDEFYTYDANGNRVSSSRHGEGYVTDANNRLVSDGTYNYEYDNQGNLISQTEIATGKIQELEWDYRNRLVAFVDRDAAGNETQRVEFSYDMFGRRLSKTVEGEATYFVYDRDDVILDFVDADGAAEPVLDKRYLHGTRVDQVLAQEDGAGDVTWHLSDHLGNIKDLADNGGTLINHFVYDSFGNVVSMTGETFISRFLFTGREWDRETGLQFNRRRYYHPQLGIFVNEDPIGFEGGDTNLYRYVENSPLIAVDPFGTTSFPLQVLLTLSARGSRNRRVYTGYPEAGSYNQALSSARMWFNLITIPATRDYPQASPSYFDGSVGGSMWQIYGQLKDYQLERGRGQGTLRPSSSSEPHVPTIDLTSDFWRQTHNTPGHEQVEEVKFRYRDDEDCNNLEPSYQPVVKPEDEKEMTPDNFPLPALGFRLPRIPFPQIPFPRIPLPRA